jgi:hypothetical protein
LLDNGSDTTAVHGGDCTPLQEAARNGHQEVVTILESWTLKQSGEIKKRVQRTSNASMLIESLSTLVESTVTSTTNIFDATEATGQFKKIMDALRKCESAQAALSECTNPLISSLAILQLHQSKLHRLSINAETTPALNTVEPSFVALIHRYVRIARGVYDGFAGVCECIISRDVLADRLDSDAGAIVSDAEDSSEGVAEDSSEGVAASDKGVDDPMPTAGLTSVVPAPAHIVYMDHLTRSMVISIRGTASLSDVITDAVCSSTPFAGGFAHAGVAAAATAMARDQELQKLINGSIPEGYKLVITGGI